MDTRMATTLQKAAHALAGGVFGFHFYRYAFHHVTRAKSVHRYFSQERNATGCTPVTPMQQSEKTTLPERRIATVIVPSASR
jgi:hypothetical protein